jgi:hypothetical protein
VVCRAADLGRYVLKLAMEISEIGKKSADQLTRYSIFSTLASVEKGRKGSYFAYGSFNIIGGS